MMIAVKCVNVAEGKSELDDECEQRRLCPEYAIPSEPAHRQPPNPMTGPLHRIALRQNVTL